VKGKKALGARTQIKAKKLRKEQERLLKAVRKFVHDLPRTLTRANKEINRSCMEISKCLDEWPRRAKQVSDSLASYIAGISMGGNEL